MAEGHDVGAHRRRIEPAAGPTVGHGLGQAGGAGVVLGQALDHVPQGHEPRCGENTRLAHAAA